jgi:hypothetical protein
MSADDVARPFYPLEEGSWAGSWNEPSSCQLTLLPAPVSDPWHRPRRGLLANEVPLRSELSLSPASVIEEALGLNPKLQKQHRAAVCLLANALYGYARSPDTFIFYSRDRNHYAEASKRPRYFPRWYSRRQVVAAIETLEHAGLIDHRHTEPSPNAEYRSRFSASEQLVSTIECASIAFVFKPSETIILRGAVGLPLNYRETDRTFKSRRDVETHNEFLTSFDIGIGHPDVIEDDRGFLRVGKCWLDPRRRSYRRIFNEKFCFGGRWYGPWWQNLPKKARSGLLINGEHTVELDYRACHLRLLYALRGLTLPFDIANTDPYEVPGFTRQEIKLAFNIMLNAKTKRKAFGAIKKCLEEEGFPEPDEHTKKLMKAVAEHFRDLGQVWCTGIGLKLQNIDAKICRCVQRRLRKADAPNLSIHDSFVVPTSKTDLLRDVMEQEMERACKGLS